MGKHGIENWGRFQRAGVEPKDIKAMKVEAITDAFEDTRKDFEHLVEQLADGIKAGRWSAILGDDVSGRFPALIVGNLAKRYAIEHGRKPPKQIFFAGGSVPFEDQPKERKDRETQQKEQQQKLENYIHSQSENLGNRVLVVTEQVRSGKTLDRIMRALKKEGKMFDLSTLQARGEAADYKIDANGARLFIGKEHAGASDPFGSEMSNRLYDLGIPLNEAAGIKKEGTSPIAKRNSIADAELMRHAREKATKLADELYTKYFSEK